MSVSQNRAKAAGSGIGAFFNNPGVLIIGALIVFIAFFRGDIRNAFGSIGAGISGGLGDINIQLPAFNFPEISFPSIDFGGFFGGGQFPNLPPGGEEGIPLTQPGEDGLNPADMPTAPSPVDILLNPPPGQDPETDPAIINPEFGPSDPNADPALFNPPGVIGFGTPGMPEGFPQGGIQIDPGLLDEVIGPFMGGGPSFEGGTIFQTPIANLSLSQIIDMFNVTASQAADIQAQAIGFTPEETAFLEQGPEDVGGFVAGGPPGVSDPQFEGLTPEEIALMLTGGPISNF